MELHRWIRAVGFHNILYTDKPTYQNLWQHNLPKCGVPQNPILRLLIKTVIPFFSFSKRHHLFAHIGVGARELVSKKIAISKNPKLQSLIISDLAQPPGRREGLTGGQCNPCPGPGRVKCRFYQNWYFRQFPIPCSGLTPLPSRSALGPAPPKKKADRQDDSGGWSLRPYG